MAWASLINLIGILPMPCTLFGLNVDIIPSTSFSLTGSKYIDFWIGLPQNESRNIWGQGQWRIQKILVGGDDKNFNHKTSKIRMCCNQARSQKFVMEQLF